MVKKRRERREEKRKKRREEKEEEEKEENKVPVQGIKNVPGGVFRLEGGATGHNQIFFFDFWSDFAESLLCDGIY
jgi:hypothetical protein